jgi:hypothetical protein
MLQRSNTLAILAACAVPAVLAVPATLAAQDLAQVCRAVANAKPGQWASFDVTGGSAGRGTLRLAIIGSERSGDSTLYWLEANFAGKDPGHSGIVQILTPNPGRGTAGVQQVIVKVGAQPAMKISGQLAGMLGEQAGKAGNNAASDWAARCTSTHVVGWESVTVPAGTFRALHVKSDDGGEAWASTEIPFGLVKVHEKESDLVLTGRGAGATSSISEKPQEMPVPGMLMQKP